MISAVTAGIVTATATNPIWVIKTRLQLDKSTYNTYTSGWECTRKIIREEGIHALYRGMSASYLGVSESTIQWVLYEWFKKEIGKRRTLDIHSTNNANNTQNIHNTCNTYNVQKKYCEKRGELQGKWKEWLWQVGAAGAAKLIATVATYPHEV